MLASGLRFGASSFDKGFGEILYKGLDTSLGSGRVAVEQLRSGEYPGRLVGRYVCSMAFFATSTRSRNVSWCLVLFCIASAGSSLNSRAAGEFEILNKLFQMEIAERLTADGPLFAG